MSEQAQGRAFWTKRRRILFAVAVVLSPFAYLLGAGPVAYLEGRGAISSQTAEALAFPIAFAADHDLFARLGVEDPVERYFSWWLQKGEAARDLARGRKK